MLNETPWLPAITGLPSIGQGGAATGAWQDAFLKASGSEVPSMFDTKQWGELQNLLLPGQGGMSPALEQLFNIGSQKINQQTSGDVATAMTTAHQRGMEGSTAEAAGVAGAQAGGQQAIAALLASLLGQQGQATSQYAGIMGQGLGQEQQQKFQQLLELLNFLSGGMESAANIGLYREGLDSANMLSKRQARSALYNSIISGASSIIGAGTKAGIEKWG